jgi:hypothetical protein
MSKLFGYRNSSPLLFKSRKPWKLNIMTPKTQVSYWNMCSRVQKRHWEMFMLRRKKVEEVEPTPKLEEASDDFHKVKNTDDNQFGEHVSLAFYAQATTTDIIFK